MTLSIVTSSTTPTQDLLIEMRHNSSTSSPNYTHTESREDNQFS